MTARCFLNWVGGLLLGALLCGCSPKAKEDGDSQTNWLEACRDDSMCSTGTKCLCGVCTRVCSLPSTCSNAQQGSCVRLGETALTVQCGGSPPPLPGLCLIRCDDSSACAKNQACVAGICSPLPATSVEVSVDLDARHQDLVGFGASVAYGEGQITSHPQQTTLYQAIFKELGLDVLRFRNRYLHVGDDDLKTAGDLVAAGGATLGRPLSVFLSSWSPPPALKANSALVCSGNVQTCTLARTTAGAFDYTGLADYWAASIGAYAKVGVVPDYIGIQNNPNYIPSSAESLEACRFLPTEGTVSVLGPTGTVSVKYPGLAQAQSATLDALSALPSRPKLLAPETSDFGSVADYLPSLDASTDALAHQLYGVNPAAIDLDALAAMGKLVSDYGRPVFVTEMQADGIGTAVLIHHATVVEGASAYLQAALIGPVSGPLTNTQALIGIDSGTFRIQDPYHAMRHFAGHTDPGWTRVDASAATGTGLLVSAWQSPSGQELTMVLINTRSVELSAHVKLPGDWSTSEVTRSVFSGTERWAVLGALSSQGVVRMPPESVVTIALSR